MAMGVLATEEAKDQIVAQTAGYTGHLGSIEGDLSGRRIDELRDTLGALKHRTRDYDLPGAINDLENALTYRRVRGENGPAYLASLDARFDEIHSALLAIDALRK